MSNNERLKQERLKGYRKTVRSLLLVRTVSKFFGGLIPVWCFWNRSCSFKSIFPKRAEPKGPLFWSWCHGPTFDFLKSSSQSETTQQLQQCSVYFKSSLLLLPGASKQFFCSEWWGLTVAPHQFPERQKQGVRQWKNTTEDWLSVSVSIFIPHSQEICDFLQIIKRVYNSENT